MKKELTEGKMLPILIAFSVPFLISCFLQTFYGLADLFITGQFNGASTITAVAVGSQVMHMLTVVIVGLSMGGTIAIGRAIGAKNSEEAAKSVGNTATIFLVFSVLASVILIFCTDGIISLIATPPEAVAETRHYLMICFAGIPFITAYNVISSIFRGFGDTKTPMYFVLVAGIVNIVLDYILIGPMGMGAAGAALATVASQVLSVLLAFIVLKKTDTGISVSKKDFVIDKVVFSAILRVGVPIAIQEGFIQISFLVITAIANTRGVTIAASVGIVEKLICFFFLVPSAMLSSVSAIAAQNAGAGKDRRATQVLVYGIVICVCFGAVIFTICQFFAEPIVRLFVKSDEGVVHYGGQYLRSYTIDCMLACIHFCFSGYFCAYNKAFYSFIHNVLSVVLVRIPGTYLAVILWPATLYPMGLAAPAGSLLSNIICVAFFIHLWRVRKQGDITLPSPQ